MARWFRKGYLSDMFKFLNTWTWNRRSSNKWNFSQVSIKIKIELITQTPDTFQTALLKTMLRCCGSVRIRIIFQDPEFVPRCLGSGSINYSNEHNKINWKGKFNKVGLLVGSCWTYWQGKSMKRCIKSTVLGTLPPWNGKEPDPCKTVGSGANCKAGSGSVSKWKERSGSASKWLDPQHCLKSRVFLVKVSIQFVCNQ